MSVPVASLQMYQLSVSSKDAPFILKDSRPEATGASSTRLVSPGLLPYLDLIEQVFAKLEALLRNTDT
jgi:hypothetical protein